MPLPTGSPVLTEEETLFAAAKSGKHEDVTNLLATNPKLAEAKDAEGKTILDHAVDNGHPEVVKVLQDFYSKKVTAAQEAKSALGLDAKNKELNDLTQQQEALKLKDKESSLDAARSDLKQKEVDTVVGGKIKALDPLGAVTEVTVTEKEQSKLAKARETAQKTINQRTVELTEAKERFSMLQADIENKKAKIEELAPQSNALDAQIAAASEEVKKANEQFIKATQKRQNITTIFNATDGAHIKVLLASDSSLISAKDKDGKTLLHHAVERRDKELSETLLKLAPSLSITQDKDGKTPLHYAAGQGNQELAKTLLELEISDDPTKKLESINIRDDQGRTPLHYAAANLDQNMGKLLIDMGASQKIQDNTGKTAEQIGDGMALMRAARDGNIERVNQYLAKDPNLISATDKDGKTPLHHAAENGHMDIANAIISKDKASLNVRDKDGKMPIHYAAEQGNQELFSTLEAAGAMTTIPAKPGGKTPEEILEEAKAEKQKQLEAQEKAKEEERLAKLAEIHAPTEGSKVMQDKSPHDQKHTKEDFLAGKLEKLAFTPEKGEHGRDFNPGENTRPMSDEKKSHVVETFDPKTNSFSYSIQQVPQPDPSPSKVHKVEGKFGTLFFNAHGEMIGAKLDGPDLSKLSPTQLKEAQSLHDAALRTSGAKVSIVEMPDNNLEKSAALSAPVTVVQGIPATDAQKKGAVVVQGKVVAEEIPVAAANVPKVPREHTKHRASMRESLSIHTASLSSTSSPRPSSTSQSKGHETSISK